MKLWKTLFICIALIPFILKASPSPVGTWTSIDDVTGKKRAMVRLELTGNTLNGRIVEVFPQPGDTGICHNCPGALKNQPVLGLPFLRDLSDHGNGVWSGGTILDPKTGKLYRAKITVEGNKLYVRAYIGISAIGRTQTWIR
jgi:uncharacterized protein (DUF2147 family)